MRKYKNLQKFLRGRATLVRSRVYIIYNIYDVGRRYIIYIIYSRKIPSIPFKVQVFDINIYNA